MNNLQNTKAHSLIEVLASAVLFSVGILAILSVFMYASRNTNISENKLAAANRGRELLEGLRSQVDSRNWDAWPLTCDNNLQEWTGELFNGQQIHYQCATEASGARQVTVIVPWE